MGENPCRVHLIGILIIVFAFLSGLAREVKRAFKQKRKCITKNILYFEELK